MASRAMLSSRSLTISSSWSVAPPWSLVYWAWESVGRVWTLAALGARSLIANLFSTCAGVTPLSCILDKACCASIIIAKPEIDWDQAEAPRLALNSPPDELVRRVLVFLLVMTFSLVNSQFYGK